VRRSSQYQPRREADRLVSSQGSRCTLESGEQRRDSKGNDRRQCPGGRSVEEREGRSRGGVRDRWWWREADAAGELERAERRLSRAAFGIQLSLVHDPLSRPGVRFLAFGLLETPLDC